MMGTPIVSKGTGPPDGKPALPGRVAEAHGVVPLPIAVSKRQTWPLSLAVVLVLLSSSAAYNEDSSTVFFQTMPDTNSDYSDSLPLQNSIERSSQAGQDLRRSSTESWLSSIGNRYTRNSSSRSAGTVSQSHNARTQWDPKRVSGSLEVTRGGQMLLSGDSQSSTGLTLSTAPSVGALVRTTGTSPELSSQEQQQLGFNTLASTLPQWAKDADRMEEAQTVDAPPAHLLTSPPSVMRTTLPVGWNWTSQIAFAVDHSPSATVLTVEPPSSEHVTRIVPGLLRTLFSSAKTVRGTHVDHLCGDCSGTIPSTETKLKELPHLQYSGTADAFGANSADSSLVPRTTADGTTDERVKPLTPRPGDSFSSGVDTYASILSVSPTQTSDPSSETTSSQQISWLNGQELDGGGAAVREPLSHSFSHSEDPTGIPPVQFSGFTKHRGTKASSTFWSREPLRVDQSLWNTPEPVAEFSDTLDASGVDGSHTIIENYTLSVPHDKNSLTSGPPLPVLSAELPTGSPSRSTVLALTSRWSETPSELPSRNASLPATLQSPNGFSNTANVGVVQQGEGTATDAPHSPAVGVPDFGPSPATADFEMGTVAFGIPSEANVLVGHKSTISAEQRVRSTSQSFLQSYVGSEEEKTESPTTETVSNTLVIERSKAESKEGPHFVEGKYTSETSIQVAVSVVPDGRSFLSTQTSSIPEVNIEYLNSWTPSAKMETGAPEGLTIAAHHREWTITEHHRREGETIAAVKMMSTDFSELSLTASDGPSVTDLFFSFPSAKPEVHPTYMHNVSPKKGVEATQFPSHDSTHSAASKQSSKRNVSAVAKSTAVHTPPAGSAPLPSSSLAVAETVPPTGIAYPGLVTGPSAQLFSMTPSKLKVSIPTPSPLTGASTDVTSVAVTHSSVSPAFMPWGSMRTSVSEPTAEATAGLMAGRAWIVPASTWLSRPSNPDVHSADPRATRTARTTYHTPLFFSTRFLRSVTSSSTMVTEGVLHFKATADFPDIVGTTTLPVLAAAQSATMPTIVNSGTLSNTPEFRRSTIPASFTPLHGTSGRQSTSESLLARKSLRTTLGLMNTRNTIVVSSAKVPNSKETNTIVPITSTTTEDVHTSEQLLPKLESQTLNWTTESLTTSSPTSLTIGVYSLSLQFCLTRIEYTESLENKSSNSYKKLEKEVRLTLNKMLSIYGNFLHFRVLHFLNGSVVVESRADFQGERVIPTPSDVIRTIVTEVEKRKMDTFFDWRVDLKSLQSNGFSLNNLEPEMLTVSFTFLGSAAAFVGVTAEEALERLRREVILLLRMQYRVQELLLHQTGTNRGDWQITGELYINTSVHVNIHGVLEALRGLVKYSVDLSSLSVNGSRLGLQVFPFSFVVTNRHVNKELLDRSSPQHKTLVRNLSDVAPPGCPGENEQTGPLQLLAIPIPEELMHILRRYQNFLQVKIREITGGSLMCHGDVIFQLPAPSSKEVLQTLSLAIGPKDYLAESTLQVDRFSFSVAGDGLEPPFTSLGVPAYVVALIAMCAVAIVAVPVLKLLPKILGWKDKITITRVGDPEEGVEIFELDNPGYHSIAEDDGHDTSLRRL